MDYEGLYEVSNQGRVLSIKRRIIMLLQDKDGYLTVGLSKDGKQQRHYVHKLVLMAFAGARPDEMQACHGPGGSLDNRWPENLRWDTKRANEVDKRGPGGPPETHCAHGHEFTPENTYEAKRPSGRSERHCRTCRRDRARANYVPKKGRHPYESRGTGPQKTHGSWDEIGRTSYTKDG